MNTTINGLRARRTALGLSREHLAREVNCSASTITYVERGHRCSDDMAQRIADALDCTPADLFSPAVLHVEAAVVADVATLTPGQ